MHVCVCICTYRRCSYLRRLLRELISQITDGLFTFSIVVVDNDTQQSAKPVVDEFFGRPHIEINYHVEERQNIALARNKAVQHSKGDYVAFIDDDEFPTSNWLQLLLRACDRYQADGALGPVKPHYDTTPPRWVVKGGFYDRPSYPTGLVIDWRKGRTGNTLLRRQLLLAEHLPFNPEFLSGEDQDLFRRLIQKGHVFVWCHEAMAYESVPPQRWRLSFMLRRALLRGQVAALEPSAGLLDTVKSGLAVVLYAVALPFLLLAGLHVFIQYLVKLCDHLGKLLGILGLNPVKESYVTE